MDDAAKLTRAKAELRDMKEKRGYVLDYHKIMAVEDLPFMKSINDVLSVSYIEKRSLSKKTKELIFSVLLAAMGTPDLVKLHVEILKKEGATKEEVLEALEMLVLSCGLPKFISAYSVWAEVFDVKPIDLD